MLDALAAAGPSLTIGDPFDAATMLGPVVSAGSRARIEGLVGRGVEAGGRVVTGGQRPAHLDRGFYYEPTVVEIDDNANPLAQTEVFGPVVTVQGYGDLDEAVAITNDSEYDLSAGVYTADLDTASALAGRIRTGTVQVNTGLANSYTPMGGYKNSGVGRERGVLGMRSVPAGQARRVRERLDAWLPGVRRSRRSRPTSAGRRAGGGHPRDAGGAERVPGAVAAPSRRAGSWPTSYRPSCSTACSTRLRELAIMGTAWLRRSVYEWTSR